MSAPQRSRWPPASAHPTTPRSIEAKKEEDARQSAMNSGDSCNQLEIEVPDVIELRRGANGAPEYRELRNRRHDRRAAMAAAGQQRHDARRMASCGKLSSDEFHAAARCGDSRVVEQLPGVHALETRHGGRRRSPHRDDQQLRQTARNVHLERHLLPLRRDQHAAMLPAAARARYRGAATLRLRG